MEVEITRIEGRKYFYLCKCGAECNAIGLAELKKRTGLCRPCAARSNFKEAAESNKLRPYEALYNNFCYKQKKRAIECTLTYKDFIDIVRIGKCTYCYQPITWTEYSVTKFNSNYYIDRKDNSLGYISGNVVPCCPTCNSIKSDKLSHEEMLVAMRAVLEYRNGRE